MTTARTIIKRSLQKIGVLTKNESPSGDEAADGLDALNDLIKSWSNDSLLIYFRQSESFPLVSGQSTYTIGPGGDFNTTRPMQILTAFTRIGGIDYDISLISDVDFDGILQKGLSGPIPQFMSYNGNAPLGEITIYPVPTTGELHIRSEKQLTEFTTLDTDLELPPGWDRALIFNLAVDIAGEYGQQVDGLTYQTAQEALNKIRTAVNRNKDMDAYPVTTNFDNIFVGWFN